MLMEISKCIVKELEHKKVSSKGKDLEFHTLHLIDLDNGGDLKIDVAGLDLEGLKMGVFYHLQAEVKGIITGYNFKLIFVGTPVFETTV